MNILTAMAENERVVSNENDPERKAIALAWLFHLVGAAHQPLHTAQLFTVEYPQIVNPCFVGRTTLSTWVFEAFISRKHIFRA